MAYARQSRNHVFIVDGTWSRLDTGYRTHAGRLYHVLTESGQTAAQSTAYHAGVQGEGLQRWTAAALGIGINEAIMAGYGILANRYRPGDKIYLFGFSRGAYAVRSLAGLIERIGLLRHDMATERRVERAFRYYQADTPSEAAQAFRATFCQQDVRISCIGVWDTVKALGLPYPVLSRVFPMATEFHDHHLPVCVDAAFHALAIDEDRTAYEPILWEDCDDWPGRLEQVWFPGVHGDVGGGLDCQEDTRPLSNINLSWMLDRAESCGLILPGGWRDRFTCDVTAPSVRGRRKANRMFLSRRPRVVSPGVDCQALHASIEARMARVPDYHPAPLRDRPDAVTEDAVPDDDKIFELEAVK